MGSGGDCLLPPIELSKQPGEIEAVVEAAGDEVYDAVRGLGASEIALWLGMIGIQREIPCPGTARDGFSGTISQQLPVTPGLPLIVRKEYRHSALSECGQHDRPLEQPFQHQSLTASDRREYAGPAGPG